MATYKVTGTTESYAGLNTYTRTTTAAGTHTVACMITMRDVNISGQGPSNGQPLTAPTVNSSSIVVTVTQNGSTMYTSPTLSPFQNNLTFSLPLNCSIGDVINCIISSGSTPDTGLQTIRTTISIRAGV